MKKINAFLEDKKPINHIALLLLGLGAFLLYGLHTLYPLPPLILIPLALFILYLAASIRIARQWERAVILRLGRFKRMMGPGPFLVIPLIDTVYKYIDQRIRVTDFQAEQTLTADTVPVNVDAVVYWMVWDAEKAALEVQNYKEAVTYIAQTGLRDTIGKHQLADLLQNRDKIASALQEMLDEITNPWSITCQHVGIKDIIIPEALANAMSKQAQAERERQARVILGTAETEIARHFSHASREYQDNPVALQLRGMNMLFEGLKEKGSLVIVHSSALDSMNMGALSGMVALGKQESGKKVQAEKTERSDASSAIKKGR